MKNAILIALALIAPKSFAFEWEGGIRETYLTRHSYTYNSDTTARVMRELVERGHSSISYHPRVAWEPEKSLFYFPTLKTPFFDLEIASVRVLQAGSRVTLRPQVFENPGLGEGVPSKRITPRRTDLAMVSYEQLMSQFLKITRKHDVHRLVVGSGLVHLLSDPGIFSRFESMLKFIKKGVGPKTEVVLEIIGNDDLKAFSSALKYTASPLKLNGLIDGVSLVLDPETHFPDGSLSVEELRKTRMMLEALLPKLPVHLARVGVPGCENPMSFRNELICGDQALNPNLQVARFRQLKDGLLSLEEDGIRFGSVEVLEASTDYEPEVPDAKYPYYNPLFRDPGVYAIPEKDLFVAPPWPLTRDAGKKNGCLYYDQLTVLGRPDKIGEIHAMMLQSTLGAFRSWNFSRKVISAYSRGELRECDAVFYLATNFNQTPPESFLTELSESSAKIPVVWFNYKFSAFAEVLKKNQKDPGFDVPYIIQADSVPGPQNENPGFYSQFDYKGETFFKLSKWNPIANSFESSPEINLVKISEDAKTRVKVLSTARHDKTNNIIPYAVQSGNIWYIADSPFSFVHYEDRFYIFCDLLWDILGEEAPKERVALVRIEDIHPKLIYKDMKWVWDYLSKEKVPFTIAMIPFYSDLFGNTTGSHIPVFSPVDKFKNFVGLMKYAQNRGADFVMHGTAHSVGCLLSGYDGESGADYEFWLYPENTPLPFDSVDWVTRRLEMGIRVFQEMGIKPIGFEAPHYAASVLDYMVFAKMFQWQYHRSIFMPFEVQRDTGLPKHLRAFNCKPEECGEERRSILRNLKVTADHTAFSGINSPFITYRDVYGQSIVPETLGMIDFVFYSSKTWRPVSTPDDIIRRAKKLKVIRGAVASFFWHPLVLDSKNVYYQENPGSFEAFGGKKSLSLVINGLRDLGYVFKSTNDKKLFPDEVI